MTFSLDKFSLLLFFLFSNTFLRFQFIIILPFFLLFFFFGSFYLFLFLLFKVLPFPMPLCHILWDLTLRKSFLPVLFKVLRDKERYERTNVVTSSLTAVKWHVH